jgi:hypothetical protein
MPKGKGSKSTRQEPQKVLPDLAPVVQPRVEPLRLFPWNTLIGAVGLLLAGIALMPMQFWGGVIAAYIGIVFTTRALLSELWSSTKVRRYGVIFATLAIAAALSRFVVFAPAPLEIRWTYVDADYPQGTPIAGIRWEPTYSEVQIVITPTGRTWSIET